MNDIAQKRLDKLISDFSAAMLVTTSLDGHLRARPMAIAGHDKGGLLYFATRAEDEKLKEVLRQPEVAVTMQDGSRFLSISGRARIETDLQLGREMWQAAMKLWFPDGAEDAQFTLIVVEPEYGEYWDRSGVRRLEFMWQAGKALIRGELPEEPSVESHAKVRPE